MRRTALSNVTANKPSRKRVKSLNIQMIFFVFYIMMCAGLLTGGCFALLYAIGIFPVPFFASFLSPFIALLVSTTVGTSITAVTVERWLKPLNQLIKATKIVSTGNFNIHVEETGNRTELGELIRNFNHMTEELGNIEVFRDSFINDFSHEFKTPIVSIRGFAKQLQNDSLPPEKRREYTDIIIHESERLSRMSTNILLLTRLENQQIVTGRTEYELDEQIRSCIILLEKLWSTKNINIELELEPVKFYNNEEMLSHLWINLMENAIKYTGEYGDIKIQCRKTAGAIRFQISDNGMGMDEYTAKHVFDKFYQGDKSHSSQGNGLGMSIVLRIVNLCGGEITVDSKVGAGTMFTVILPEMPITQE